MRLLILDLIRRQKWVYLSAGLFITLFMFAPSSFSTASIGLWGGMVLGSGYLPREIYMLPISRKEIWQARCVAWVVIPVVVYGASGLLSVGIASMFSNTALRAGGAPDLASNLSWILLSSSYALVYSGTVLAISIPVSNFLARSVSPLNAVLIKGVLFTAAAIVGFRFASKLPMQWQQMTAIPVLLLWIGLSLTVLAFFHAPRIAPRRIAPMAFLHSARLDVKATPVRPRLTGMKLFVWCQIRAVVFVGVASGIASQLPLVVVGWTEPDRLSLIERGTLFFQPLPGGPVMLFFTPIMFAAFWILMAPDILGVRSLRTLPISTRTIAAMFTLIPVLFWTTFWVFPIASYAILSGHLPPALRLDLLAGLIGLTCLVSSAATKAGIKGLSQFVALPAVTIVGFSILHFYGQPLSFMRASFIGGLGLIAVAISYRMHYHALQRNSSVYVSKLRLRGLSQPSLIAQ